MTPFAALTGEKHCMMCMMYDMSLIRAINTRRLKISATAFFLDHWSSTFSACALPRTVVCRFINLMGRL
jgi:hypothetical protein